MLDNSGTSLEYTTSPNLTPGTTYSFKITAENDAGSSILSDPVSILAAKIPDAPLNLNNEPSVTTAYQIGLTW